MFVEDKANGETPSRDGFMRFVEGHNPTDTYNWADSCNCAVAQYLKSIGQFDPNWMNTGDGITMGLNMIAAGRPRANTVFGAYDPVDWTFGKCLERIKELEPA